MTRRPRRPHTFRPALLLALPLLLAAGCQSAPTVDTNGLAFDNRVRLATEAINDGDLHTARTHIHEAEAKASDHVQKRQVHSLDSLVGGAEALMAGDVALARAAWSRIDDPRLNHKVRRNASRIGIDVPLLETPETASKESK